MDEQTAMLAVTLIAVALYALVIISCNVFVSAAVGGIVLAVVAFVVCMAFFAAFFFWLMGSLFLTLFGMGPLNISSIARDLLSDKVASLLTTLIYMALITPGLIALRRGVVWWKAGIICLVPAILMAGGLPALDYYVQHSEFKRVAGEEVSLSLPQRPRQLAINQTAYDITNIDWRDPLGEVPCTEYCLDLLRSGQVEAIQLQRTIKFVMRAGGINVSSVAAVYRIARGEICGSSGYRQPRAVASVPSEGDKVCILGEPAGQLPSAVEISFTSLPDGEHASGQKIEIVEGASVLWRRAAWSLDVASFPYMLDSRWRPFTRAVLFGSFVPEKEAKAREMPDRLVRSLLTEQLGYELR